MLIFLKSNLLAGDIINTDPAIALAERIDKGMDILIETLDKYLYHAIIKIPDRTGQMMLLGQHHAETAKAHTLHSAFNNDIKTFHFCFHTIIIEHKR